MHALEPSVVENYQAEIDRLRVEALKAHQKGEHEQGNIYIAEADTTRAQLNEYRFNSFPQKPQ